jgi:rRNA maturation endonuclease Nob1
LDWKLESEIFQDSNYEICENCGVKYRKTNNHMKYCPDCRSVVRRRKKRQYEADRRAKKRV